MTHADATLPVMLQRDQRYAARVVGLLYLVTMASSVLAVYLRSPLVVHGDAVRTAVASMAAEPRFRLAILMDVVTTAGVVGLIAGLHVVLRPVDRYWALTALSLRLIETCVFSAAGLGLLAFLVLLGGSPVLATLPTAELQVLAYAALRVHDASYAVGFTFLGLGSAVFAGLWVKSGYIPWVIAAWGVFSSLLMAIASMAVIVFPALNGVLGMYYMLPLAIFEIGVGIWLLAYGLRDPVVGYRDVKRKAA